MSEFSAELGDVLDGAVDALYEEMKYEAYTPWMLTVNDMNAGQVALMVDYYLPAMDDWLREAKQDWPFVDTTSYEGALYNAYDFDVGDAAFSLDIDAALWPMQDTINRAQELYAIQLALEFLELLIEVLFIFAE